MGRVSKRTHGVFDQLVNTLRFSNDEYCSNHLHDGSLHNPDVEELLSRGLVEMDLCQLQFQHVQSLERLPCETPTEGVASSGSRLHTMNLQIFDMGVLNRGEYRYVRNEPFRK